jgi:hypothetical protein
MEKIALTAVVARRKKDGKLVLLESIEKKGAARIVEHELDESSDHALNLYGRLRITKGEGGRYTAATLFLRSSALRKLKFG